MKKKKSERVKWAKKNYDEKEEDRKDGVSRKIDWKERSKEKEKAYINEN